MTAADPSKSTQQQDAVSLRNTGDPKLEDANRNFLSKTALPSKRIENLVITVFGSELSGNTLVINFRVLNESSQNASLMLFGHGSFGNGGSKMYANGKEYLASNISIGAAKYEGAIHKEYYSQIPLEGKLTFNNIPSDLKHIDLLAIAYSDGNLRPAGAIQFRSVSIQ